MGRACRAVDNVTNPCKIYLGKPKVKRSLVIPRCRWNDNIKMGLRKQGRR
jgi:hypothetical protein